MEAGGVSGLWGVVFGLPGAIDGNVPHHLACAALLEDVALIGGVVAPLVVLAPKVLASNRLDQFDVAFCKRVAGENLFEVAICSRTVH